MKKETNITHKELLTFSNLTNLEMEFVDLNQIAKNAFGEESEEKLKLNDLLAPENFVRVYEDGTKEYRYGADEEGNLISKEQGLFEMHQKAGIAMEYLEKWQEYEETGGARGTDEGSFLQDWEVIYAADNYKAIADYLDYKKNKKAE